MGGLISVYFKEQEIELDKKSHAKKYLQEVICLYAGREGEILLI